MCFFPSLILPLCELGKGLSEILVSWLRCNPAFLTIALVAVLSLILQGRSLHPLYLMAFAWIVLGHLSTHVLQLNYISAYLLSNIVSILNLLNWKPEKLSNLLVFPARLHSYRNMCRSASLWSSKGTALWHTSKDTSKSSWWRNPSESL